MGDARSSREIDELLDEAVRTADWRRRTELINKAVRLHLKRTERDHKAAGEASRGDPDEDR